MERSDAYRLTDALHAEQGRGDPFAGAVRATRMPMLISDPRQADNPIVFANNAFLTLSGYEREEILGRNCRFLQGPETDPSQIALIRDAIARQTDVAVEILNYRKDGTTFWNALYLSPVFGDSGELQFFFASQFDVTDRKEREVAAIEGRDFFENAVAERTSELRTALDQKTMLLHEVDHRVKNNLQMIASMIKSQARNAGDEAVKTALGATLARVEALGSVHRRLYRSNDIAIFSVSEFIREIATGLVSASGRPGIALDLDLDDIDVPSNQASPIALLVNELLTNSLKHAYPGYEDEGRISVATRSFPDRIEIVVADDGAGTGQAVAGQRSFGHRLIEALLRQMNATLTVEDASPGTAARISIPNPVARRAM